MLLVVSEVALALMLTVGAGLLVRSFWRLRQVEPGLRSARRARGAGRPQPDVRQRVKVADAFWNQLMERARAIPGVTNAAHAEQPAAARA